MNFLSLCLAFTFPTVAFAAQTLCFDFSTKVVKPLLEVPRVEGSDKSDLGTRQDRVNWAALRGDVPNPIEKVFERLKNHETTRDSTISSFSVEEMEKGPYLARHRVKLTVKVLFLQIRWTEEWVYALAEGTPEQPQTIVISYQKTEGTEHMPHFCDNIVLRKTPTGTDVSHYQEGRITGRSPQAMLDYQKGVLQRLRTP